MKYTLNNTKFRSPTVPCGIYHWWISGWEVSTENDYDFLLKRLGTALTKDDRWESPTLAVKSKLTFIDSSWVLTGAYQGK